MTQMEEQNKTAEKELKEMEMSSLLDAESKALVLRVLSELSESLNIMKNTSQKWRIH